MKEVFNLSTFSFVMKCQFCKQISKQLSTNCLSIDIFFLINLEICLQNWNTEKNIRFLRFNSQYFENLFTKLTFHNKRKGAEIEDLHSELVIQNWYLF